MEEKGKATVTESWLRKHPLVYTGATRHPFIHYIRDGIIDLPSFKTWLGQVYLFVVRSFVPFVASVLVKASKQSDDRQNDEELILGDLAALNEEIAWYKSQASKWGVQLSVVVPKLPNQDYSRYLESLISPEVEYPVAVTALWAIETVYQDGFAHCLEDGNKTPTELLETCQRWGNESFGNYCRSLANIVDRCLERAPEDLKTKAEVTFLRVLELEVQFRNIILGGA